MPCVSKRERERESFIFRQRGSSEHMAAVAMDDMSLRLLGEPIKTGLRWPFYLWYNRVHGPVPVQKR